MKNIWNMNVYQPVMIILPGMKRKIKYLLKWMETKQFRIDTFTPCHKNKIQLEHDIRNCICHLIMVERFFRNAGNNCFQPQNKITLYINVSKYYKEFHVKIRLNRNVFQLVNYCIWYEEKEMSAVVKAVLWIMSDYFNAHYTCYSWKV